MSKATAPLGRPHTIDQDVRTEVDVLQKALQLLAQLILSAAVVPCSLEHKTV